jgi:ADP-dependent NAD(P)H-hydrate dehydratase / NAD(P)H-hydrate epimerase
MAAGSHRVKSGRALDIADVYSSRGKDVRKGDFGRLVIAGGSDRYAGCLAFCGLAALRAGVDLSIIVAPRRAADIAAGYSPDLITVPCNSAFPEPMIVGELLSNADALVLGCGVVRTQSAHNALRTIIKRCTLPIVADAEALHAIAEKPSLASGKRILLTPNAGEFHTLTGTPWPRVSEDRARAVRALSRRYKATVIVKGAEDYVSDGDNVFVDREGSPYMTKGGYGDLLAGIAAAVLARGKTPLEAARVAAYLVGRAGMMASQKYGEGTLASDALAQISTALALSRR